jgi:hypothetical protein
MVRAAAFGLLATLLPWCAWADWKPRPAGDAEFAFQRSCKPGETRVYELERRVYDDDSLTYRATAVSSHTVLACEPYSESVRFSELFKFAGRQPIDLAKEAAAFPGFFIALASGPVDDEAGPSRPALRDADQTLRGLARDLHSVFVSAASAAGSGRLRRVGDAYVNPALRKDRRRDASGPGGRDACIQVRMGLVEMTPTRVSLRTSLSAPQSPCLKPLKPWVEEPVESGGAPNNYQQVSCVGGICSVRWGQDRTVVDAVLDRRTGILISAGLEVVRVRKERTGCDTELEHCSPESPLLSRRRFNMKLREALP